MHTTEQLRPVWPVAGREPDEPLYGDAMVRGGQIGPHEIERGCYSFTEVCGLAIEDLIANEAADAFDRSGLTVRAFLRQRYGILMASADAPGQDPTEAQIFRRVLRRVVQRKAA